MATSSSRLARAWRLLDAARQWGALSGPGVQWRKRAIVSISGGSACGVQAARAIGSGEVQALPRAESGGADQTNAPSSRIRQAGRRKTARRSQAARLGKRCPREVIRRQGDTSVPQGDLTRRAADAHARVPPDLRSGGRGAAWSALTGPAAWAQPPGRRSAVIVRPRADKPRVGGYPGRAIAPKEISRIMPGYEKKNCSQ